MKVPALVFCGDAWHPAATARRGLATFSATGLAFEFCEDDAACSSARLEKFDVAVLARANAVAAAKPVPWLKSDAEHGFVELVQRGGGLLVVHAGAARYENLPALNALIGGAFVRHPDPCLVTVEPAAGRVLTRDVKSFSATDEHYFVRLDDARAEVFLHAKSAHGVQPAGWARTEGTGRVCVLTPGHNLDVWRHPEYQKLLLSALHWTAKTK